MKKKLGLLTIFACLLTLGFISCDDGNDGNGGNGGPPVFTLTNINSTHQSEGSEWFVFGLFPTGTSDAVVLADAKAHRSQNNSSAVVAYAGGSSVTLPWHGTPPGNLSISTILISASNHTSTWNGSGLYDGWILVYNGSVWNGYKSAINVQGNVTGSAANFTKTITNQP